MILILRIFREKLKLNKIRLLSNVFHLLFFFFEKKKGEKNYNKIICPVLRQIAGSDSDGHSESAKSNKNPPSKPAASSASAAGNSSGRTPTNSPIP